MTALRAIKRLDGRKPVGWHLAGIYQQIANKHDGIEDRYFAVMHKGNDGQNFAHAPLQAASMDDALLEAAHKEQEFATLLTADPGYWPERLQWGRI